MFGYWNKKYFFLCKNSVYTTVLLTVKYQYNLIFIGK